MSETRKASEWNPRPGDLPVDELVRQADEEIRKGWTVNFKFTCAWCGQRCTLAEEDTIYPEGECFICGKSTIIDVGGMVKQKAMKIGEFKDEYR